MILKIEFAREEELCDDALATRPMHPILRALVERNLLVCVGPLVSEAAGFAGPRRLAEHIIELPDLVWGDEITRLVEAGEVALALERAETILGSTCFAEVARPLLDRGDARLPLVARAIAALSPTLSRICTTNLDTLLERALESWPAVDTEPRDLGARERCLVKLCGTAAQVSSWVLTRERLVARGAELPRTASWLRSHRILFVGYRADDEVLRRLVLMLRGRDAAGSCEQPVNLAFVPADSVTPESRELLSEHGIELVPVVGDYDLVVAEHLHAIVDALQRATGTRVTELPGARQRHQQRWRGEHTGHWCPYPGLVPYTSGDEAKFFGRAGDVRRAVEQLRARPESRWLIVHGADGIGASSFVAAGLFPAVMRGASWTLPGAPTWQGLQVRLHRQPHFALAKGLCPLGPPGHPYWAAFSRDAGVLTNRLASSHPGGLVLVVDGIEAAIDSDEKEQRERFAAVLAHALAHSPAPFLLITPIRSRYLGELHRLPQLHERMVGHHAPPVLYALAPMDADQLRQVIRGPGERAGHVVAERLVERILADLEDLATKQAPPPGIALALLAAALSETYRNMQQGELCVTAYETAGGLTGAVERFAERTLARALDEFSERWVRELFLMVIDGQIDQRWVRHPLQLLQVLESLDRRFRQSAPHVPRAYPSLLLQRLSGSTEGLLSVSDLAVTLVHDVLLSHWPRLRAWPALHWQPPPEPSAALPEHPHLAAPEGPSRQEQRTVGSVRQAATASTRARAGAPAPAGTTAPAVPAAPVMRADSPSPPTGARWREVWLSLVLAVAVVGGLVLGRSTSCEVRPG